MQINIELDDNAVRQAFNRLLAGGANVSPLLGEIGEHLQTTTKDRFGTQKAPDSTPWAPLSPATIATKKKNKDKILIQDRYLRDNISYQLSGDTLLVGSSRIYASTHQFGAEKGSFGKTTRDAPIPFGDIPARPFLGLSDDDRRDTLTIVSDYIAKTVGSAL